MLYQNQFIMSVNLADILDILLKFYCSVSVFCVGACMRRLYHQCIESSRYLCSVADVVSVMKMGCTACLVAQVGDVRACSHLFVEERVSVVTLWSMPVVTFMRCVPVLRCSYCKTVMPLTQLIFNCATKLKIV